ncbi:hypothetical protein JCM12298_23600 [Desulfothermus naphthae]
MQVDYMKILLISLPILAIVISLVALWKGFLSKSLNKSRVLYVNDQDLEDDFDDVIDYDEEENEEENDDNTEADSDFDSEDDD